MKRLQRDGFTIIEVMIVLVIAAVIILIVFLAVPALQRNSRNNQRKNDVAKIAAAINEYKNNANRLPQHGVYRQNINTPLKEEVIGLIGDLGYYKYSIGGTHTFSVEVGGGDSLDPSETETVLIRTEAKCNDDMSSSGSSTKVFAVHYVLEGGSDGAPQCLDG